MNRRSFLKLLGSIGVFVVSMNVPVLAKNVRRVIMSNKEWKEVLTPEQYYVLRKHGTEAPMSSHLDQFWSDGTYHCAGCDTPLFKSEHKYDSGTGWPSFHTPIEDNIDRKTDWKLIIPRTEYHCIVCKGHQGHVFEDGPEPTGLRYCNNGVALKFKPKE